MSYFLNSLLPTKIIFWLFKKEKKYKTNLFFASVC